MTLDWYSLSISCHTATMVDYESSGYCHLLFCGNDFAFLTVMHLNYVTVNFVVKIQIR